MPPHPPPATAADAAALTDATFPAIDPADFATISAAIFPLIHEDRFKHLDPLQAVAITDQQAPVITPAQFEKIPAAAFARLRARALALTPPDRFQGMTAAQAGALTQGQAAALTPLQFPEIPALTVAAIPDRLIRHIQVGTIRTLKDPQAAAITWQQAGELTPPQEGAITTAKKCQMTKEALQRIAIFHYLPNRPRALAQIVYQYLKLNGFASLTPEWQGNTRYGNANGLLPRGQYKEFDVFPLVAGRPRGVYRVVISDDAVMNGWDTNHHYNNMNPL